MDLITGERGSGHVYVIEGHDGNLVKIGKTKNPQKRIATLRTQALATGRSWVSGFLKDSNSVEKFAHKHFSNFRVGGEWFSIEFSVAVDFMAGIKSSPSLDDSPLKTYFMALPVSDRESFAKRCGTTRQHLTNIAYGNKPCGESLCINIERESVQAVVCETLRPDVDWAFIRNSRKKKAA